MSKKIKHIYRYCPENTTGIWGGSLTEVKKWNYRKEFEKLIKEEK